MVYHEMECTVCGDAFMWNPDTDGPLADCECGSWEFKNKVTGDIVKVGE